MISDSDDLYMGLKPNPPKENCTVNDIPFLELILRYRTLSPPA